ncbi:heterokaryon incompatibility protein-domain-containing protein [Exophiala viscosa]|uniref:Heterokaryon incompatibility protein-domain-containing protein n=2 Tax=Exophiala viscosa TaxID=2486360 RepID=A0AAN6ICP8_9EURO|nr:heterokaryon incompatibility protein-domain-containing protein [Exophiala viscosa]
MRLINTHTGEFRTFWDSQRPHYAILSHTWGDEEVSYLDYLFLTSNLPVTSVGVIHALLKTPRADSAGIRKIRNCCKLAKSRGYDWVWIDTCCIDQSSSAELSEAINSMWAWYRDAAECYVYLVDVSARSQEDIAPDNLRSEATQATREQFRKARWFERGWTLQELLAPRKELFCDNTWEVIAEKSDIGEELSKITKIPLAFLDGTVPASDNKLCSIAMRMSWVSHRQTTRIEDMAYCMLGLFDVHMPLIYGEGRK